MSLESVAFAKFQKLTETTGEITPEFKNNLILTCNCIIYSLDIKSLVGTSLVKTVNGTEISKSCWSWIDSGALSLIGIIPRRLSNNKGGTELPVFKLHEFDRITQIDPLNNLTEVYYKIDNLNVFFDCNVSLTNFVLDGTLLYPLTLNDITVESSRGIDFIVNAAIYELAADELFPQDEARAQLLYNQKLYILGAKNETDKSGK